MLDILAITMPIYLIIGLGFSAVRWGYIPQTALGPLTLFLMRIGLPVLIFRTVATAGVDSVVNPALMIAIALAGLPMVLLGRATLTRAAGITAPKAWSLSLGMGNPNTVMIGLPLLMTIYPDLAATVFTSSMLVENILLIPLTLIMADMSATRHGGLWLNIRGVTRSVATNHILLAVLLGLAVRASGLDFPAPVARTINMIAQIAPGLALFLVGAMVAQYNLCGSVPLIAWLSAGKLILHPLLALLTLSLFLPKGDLFTAGLILSSLPMLTIYPMFAQKSDSQDIAATALVIATALSFISVTTVLWLLGV